MDEGNVVELRAERGGGGGFVLAEAAPVDKVTKRRVTIYEPDKGRQVGVVNVEYYVNRLDTKQTELTDEEMDGIDPDDKAAISSRKNAKDLAKCIASWDMYGDSNKPGFVRDDELVPITPEMIEMVPLWVRNQILDSLLELINPNLKRSTGSRRRS